MTHADQKSVAVTLSYIPMATASLIGWIKCYGIFSWAADSVGWLPTNLPIVQRRQSRYLSDYDSLPSDSQVWALLGRSRFTSLTQTWKFYNIPYQQWTMNILMLMMKKIRAIFFMSSHFIITFILYVENKPNRKCHHNKRSILVYLHLSKITFNMSFVSRKDFFYMSS